MDFHNTLKRLSPKLRAITRRLNGKFTFFDEEDLYQEALLYLLQLNRRKALQDKTESFLLQGCYYHLKNYIRTVWKRTDACSLSLDNCIHEDGLSLEETFFKKEGSAALEFILRLREIKNRLSEREKQVFSLTLEGFTTREIGQRMGTTHVVVIKLIRRIKERCIQMEKITS